MLSSCVILEIIEREIIVSSVELYESITVIYNGYVDIIDRSVFPVAIVKTLLENLTNWNAVPKLTVVVKMSF